MVEVHHVSPEEAELAVAGPKHVNIVGDTHHDGVRSPVDGSIIDSKRKRREHMKQHGLADPDDFKNKWAEAEKRRTEVRAGHFDNKERKEAIDKAFWQVTEKKYKPATARAQVEALDKGVLDVKNNITGGEGVVQLKGDM